MGRPTSYISKDMIVVAGSTAHNFLRLLKRVTGYLQFSQRSGSRAGARRLLSPRRIISSGCLNVLRAIYSFLKDQDQGQVLAEYCLIAALIVLIALGIFWRVSGGIQGL